MYAKWENFQTSAQTVPALNGPFTSKAMKESDCPYPAEFCVPLPMVEVAEVMGRFCVPKMQMFAKDASGAVVPTAAAVTPESFDGSGKSVIGDFIADQRNSWQATVIVAFASAIVAFLFMILLRYFVGCVIWGMIALIFLVLVAGGLLLVLYSVSCTGQSIIESGTKIANSASSGDPTAVNAFYGDSSCSNGKAVKDPAMRDVVKYIGYGFFGLAAVYVLIICCMNKRIRLGIAINKVAAQFIGNNPLTITIPMLQISVCLVWWAIWIVFAMYTVSKVPDDAVDKTGTFTDFNAAVKACKFADMVRIKYVQRVASPYSAKNVYACYEPRYNLDYVFAYEFFSLLWVNAFVIAVGQMAIAGAVGVWYFTPNTEKSSVGTGPFTTGLWNCFRYHLGTLAFGSFILAVVQFIKYMLKYIEQQSKRTGNKAMEIIAKVLAYVVWCFEKCIKFLNKNAYIQTALMGTKFCKSAYEAFMLILRNALRIAALAGIGGIINLIGVVMITVGTAFVGYLILLGMYGDKINSPIGPVIIYVIIGYVIAQLFMNVFSLAVDATLQCFVADEELNKSSGGAKSTPSQLQSFVSK